MLYRISFLSIWPLACRLYVGMQTQAGNLLEILVWRLELTHSKRLKSVGPSIGSAGPM